MPSFSREKAGASFEDEGLTDVVFLNPLEDALGTDSPTNSTFTNPLDGTDSPINSFAEEESSANESRDTAKMGASSIFETEPEQRLAFDRAQPSQMSSLERILNESDEEQEVIQDMTCFEACTARFAQSTKLRKVPSLSHGIFTKKKSCCNPKGESNNVYTINEDSFLINPIAT